MLRRVLLTVPFATLALAGAASATLGAAAPSTTTTQGLTTTSTTPTTTTSPAATTIVVSGHGWGHGIGMSQWGAYGYALHGWKFPAILAHYYSGTTLGTRRAVTLRVVLADGARRVTLSSPAAWQVTDAAGLSEPLPPGDVALTPQLLVGAAALQSPLTFTATTAPLEVEGNPYRGGIVVSNIGGKLEVVNSVSLEGYLKGVVAAEMPPQWPLQALEAQAVAARSFAMASLGGAGNGKQQKRDFDLYSDYRSQEYGGINAESPRTSKAVEGTAHQVVLYHGTVATTWFSASSGGRTESAAEGTGTAVPYLQSVPDPYDTASPYHDWGPVLLDANAAAHELGLPGKLLDLETSLGPTGRVQDVTAIGSKSKLVLSGTAVRSDLGLRSNWFTLGWLALTPPHAPLHYGGTASLTGVVRGLSGVSLEQRSAGGVWQTVAPVKPDATGAFSAVVQPTTTTQYRLATGNVVAALVKLAVAPVVEAAAVLDGVTGTVRPVLSGAPVEVQQQAGSGWTTVATSTTNAAGAFSVTAKLSPGAYRVRCTPARRLAPGVSPTLTVT